MSLYRKVLQNVSLQSPACTPKLLQSEKHVSLHFHHKLQQATIQSDYMEIVKLSSSEGVPPWEISAFVDDIRHFSRVLNLRFLHKPRALNRAAHWVAAHTLSNSIPLSWVSCPPPELKALQSSDCNQHFPM
ncbi:unnamed protein product [Ilex paraguariensis]|uniref:RNase H type-1 domain-containing protein n=1 Tax=Ilex paraguariensis TaxID=185542 RepID=A0ABC8URY2_9AQUA